jgi:hypothetical protein
LKPGEDPRIEGYKNSEKEKVAVATRQAVEVPKNREIARPTSESKSKNP